MTKPISPLWLLLALFYLFSLTTYSIWTIRDRNGVTGDEPHYLVMASGIARHFTFEQSEPYKEEFVNRTIYRGGLAPANAEPSPENTHAVRGPRGLFNIHNVGLPMLLSIPFAIAGVAGAKLFMILLSGAAVVLAWKLTGTITQNINARTLITLGTAISLPLIPASNQIYPDIPAGIISLGGIYWLVTVKHNRAAMTEAAWMATIAYLPWLQIKLAAPMAVLAFAIGISIIRTRGQIGRAVTLWCVVAISAALLGLYNQYAFGKFSGPYQDGALEFSRTAFMVFVGLFIDQNQGFLFEAPLLFAGVPALGAMFKRQPLTTITWALVFFSLLLPNALHPAWYGGFSFCGRFGWAAALIFFLPAITGLSVLAEKYPRYFLNVVKVSCVLQLYFFALYATNIVNLYKPEPATWLNSYSLYFFPLQNLLPALYNVEWAFQFLPNIAWLIFVLALVLFGFKAGSHNTNKRARSVIIITIAFGVSLLIVSSLNVRKEVAQFWGAELPANTGAVMGQSRAAVEPTDKPGYVSYGPYFPLRFGSYSVTIEYSSTASTLENIGYSDVYDTSKGRVISQIELAGTEGKPASKTINFSVANLQLHRFEFRNTWNGAKDLAITKVTIKNIQ